MNDQITKNLGRLFFHYFGRKPGKIILLPYGGSSRSYYRIITHDYSAVGVYNPDYKENETFLYMTRFFQAENIPVPSLYLTNLDKNLILLEDLGDKTLFSVFKELENHPEREAIFKNLLKEAVSELARIQIIAGRKFDFSKCYESSEFGREDVLFDLEYFREQFLDRLGYKYSVKGIQTDFQNLADILNAADRDYFMYRDFQSRNIMMFNNKLYFIDYQGGRKGPLQYDLASLLYQARAGIPESTREEILEYYLKVARMFTPVMKSDFLRHYYAIALVRVLQTLGAYGLRGLEEKKNHFIQSIPFALNNLKVLSEKVDVLDDLPILSEVINGLKYTKLENYGIQP